jgi:arsenate reductase
MAEAWARHQARAKNLEVEAMSAGMTPLGSIPPETCEVMAEKKVSLEGQESKGREAIDWEAVDVLVNLTGLPWRSVLPAFRGRVEQWDVRDPYGEPIEIYRKVRDQLERKVKRLLADLKKSSAGEPPPAPAA